MKANVDGTYDVPDRDSVGSNNLDFSGIDFDGLTAKKKEQATKMLREESNSFAESDDDIGAAPDLILDINP